MAQNYATVVDVRYEDCETDAWSMLLYYPSPTMPKRSMSKYLHWWIFMDLYEAVLDKMTADLKKVKIQKCKCGYLVINFYGYIWQHHHELINPDDGTIRKKWHYRIARYQNQWTHFSALQRNFFSCFSQLIINQVLV